MAEFSYPWGVDATDAASADSRLYQVGWREILGSALADCVVLDRSNASPTSAPLYVSAPGTGTVITIAAGSAVVQGFLYDNTANKTIDVATVGTQPSAGQSRTDSVILKLDPTATPASTRLSVQLKAGTSATTGSQVAPTLTKSPTGVWEVEIARLTRATGANVLQANITQLQPSPITAVRSTNAPGNPTVDQRWVDTNDREYVWTGTAWKYIGGGIRPLCMATNTTQSSVANATFTTTALDQEVDDTDNMHSTVTNTSRITCNTPGRYRVWGCSAWNYVAGGSRGGILKMNGTTLLEGSYTLMGASVAATGSAAPLTAVPIHAVYVQLAAGDYVELQVFQASGAALTLATSAGLKPFLAAEWVSP